MEITVIGDVHGKILEYKKIVDKCSNSICVGDFGFQKEWDWHRKNVDQKSHRIVMGNHDFLPYLYKRPSLGDFGVHEGIFVVRGAFSIDKVHRTEGVDWFDNEELPYSHALRCFDTYARLRPEIVISHDAPHYIRHTLFGITDKSDTSNLLEAMFREHAPKLWIFGHHHRDRDSNILGTRFICLPELQTIKIETDEYIGHTS